MTTERIANWLKIIAWFCVLCAFVFCFRHVVDESSFLQFVAIPIFAMTLILGFAVHSACVLVVALARDKEILAPRSILILVVVGMFGLWSYGVLSLTWPVIITWIP